MQLKSILTAFLFFNFVLLEAQVPIFEWAGSIGTTGSDYSFDMKLDQNKNIYVTGSFHNTVDFDMGPGVFNLTSAGGNDFFVCKFDSLGGLIWAKRIGGSVDEEPRGLTLDDFGNLYVTGYFDGTVDFDPDTGTYNMTGNNGDVFILKLDTIGNFKWAKRMGGSGNDLVGCVVADISGSVYTFGTFELTVDFDPGVGISNLVSSGQWDLFVQKLDSSGNFIWAKSVGGVDYEMANSMAIDENNNIYMSGQYMSATCDFDPGIGVSNAPSVGAFDIYIWKLNSSGNFKWVKTFGSANDDTGFGITTDKNGFVYATGMFSGAIDFDPGVGTTNLISSGVTDAYIEKLDTAGNFVWAKKMGGSSNDKGQGIAVDQTGNVYVAGEFKSTADFDPGLPVLNLTSVGGYDAFIESLDNNGNFIWVRRLGGTSTDNCTILAVDSNNNLYASGNFKLTSDFDPGSGTHNLTSAGSEDIFIEKFSQCIASPSTILPVSCGPYTSPSGNYVWSTTGSYTDYLTSAIGCDSVITVNLTVHTIDTALTNTAGTLASNNPGATFQWVDCNNSFAPISGEIGQSFTPIVNGNYAVIINVSSCTDTSVCVAMTSIGIQDNDSENHFSIFPNPTENIFYIDLKKIYAEVQIEMIDISGKVVYVKSSGETNLISVTVDLVPGMYFVNIILGKEREVLKVIIH